MRTNSPMDDPAPYEMPKIDTPEPEKKPKVQGINKKTVGDYIQGRIDYFDKYLPNGTSVLDLPADEAGRWWQMAATLKAEFLALNEMVQGKKDDK